MIDVKAILPHACKLLEVTGEEDLCVKSIKRGGSGRQVYRISRKDEATTLSESTPTLESVIGMVYSVNKPENLKFVEEAQWLNSEDINSPEIYLSDNEQGYALVEDLGSNDLYSYKDSDWETVKAPLYKKAIDQITELNQITPPEELALELEPEFDLDLYLWEQDYFITHFLGDYLGLQHSHKEELKELRAHECLHRLACKLGSLKKSLIHRDFQSQNLMVKDDHVFLIDFQGMRMGRLEYDLASLLYDPYVNLSAAEITELKQYASSISEAPEEHFNVIFTRCAIQRLMQALGAFAKLTKEGYTHFEQYIPAAQESLKTLIDQNLNIESLLDFLSIERPED